FAVAVLPRAAWFDVSRFCSRAGEPLAQIPGDELWAVVGAKMLRHTLGYHHVGQRFDHLGRAPSAFRPNHQALSGVLVDQIQHPYRPAVVRLRAHEVVRPDVVGVLRPLSLANNMSGVYSK